MRLKPLLAAAGALLLAAYFAAPAHAQDGTKPICANCHEQPHNSILMHFHGAKNDANGSMCQACHGDASAHLKDPSNKPANRVKYGTPAEKTAVCMTCHATNRHLAFWESGRHANNDVTCSNCHSTHGGNDQLLRVENPPIQPYVNTSKVPQQEVCFTCHRDIRAQVLRPSHHPIQEGKVKCSSCHNPHGALSHAMLRHESVNEQCYSCHADKRGPFMFEHPPVAENCLNCHNPHGSRSARLLKEKAPNLCQDCHDASQHPGTAYDLTEAFPPVGTAPSTRFIARSCLNCHQHIHGSNAPASRGRRFVR